MVDTVKKPQTDITSFETLEGLAHELMTKWQVPGVTVGILKDGERELYAFGEANMETKLPMREDMVLQIGSISKVYTATLVMKLVEEGKLDLDTPVKEYLPDLKLADEDALNTITLRHTLSHTSGIYGDHFEDFGDGDDALEKYVDSFDTLRQMFKPSELWSYCNSGFSLAGRVIEVVLDTTFEAAMKEYLFDPLGMDHSTFFAKEAITMPHAVGHSETEPGSNEFQVAKPYILPRAVAAAGLIISNVNDMLSFAELHLNEGTAGDEQFLKAENVKAMQQPVTKAANFADEWGIGWDLNTIDGELVIGHGGSTNGFQARMTLVPGKKFAVAILTNGSNGWAVNNPIARWAVWKHCGLFRPDPEPIERPESELEQFAGVYTSPNAEMTVSLEDGGIKVSVVATPPSEGDDEEKTEEADDNAEENGRKELPPFWAKPISDLEFVVTTGGAHGMRLDFIPNDDGSIRFMRYGGRLSDRE